MVAPAALAARHRGAESGTERHSVEATVDAARGDLRLLRLLRATPLAAWGMVALFAVLGAVWAVAVPLLHGPDEGAHVDRIASFGLAEQFSVDPTADLRYSLDLLAAYPQVGIEPVDHRVLPRLPWTPLNTADALPADQRVPYPDLAPYGLADSRFVNAARSHPPGYYATVDALDAVVTTLGVPSLSDARWDATIARWRLFSALLLLPIPWTAFWIAARLVATGPGPAATGPDAAERVRRTGLIAATFTLAAPQLSHSAGTVNNDALLFAGASVCTLAAAWLATGDRSRGALLWAGAGAGVAAFAKIFGIGAPVWIVAAILVGASAAGLLSAEQGRRRVVQSVLVAAGATVVAGGWHLVVTLVRYGTVAPRGFGYPRPDQLDVSLWTWLREAAERLPSTGFGRMGIEQFGIPGWSVWVATILLVGLVTLSLRASQLRGRLGVAVVLLLPLATTLTMVAWAAWGGYSRSGVPSGLHGRYLFVAAPALAALSALGLRHALENVWRPRRIALLCTVLLAAGYQALGLGVALANWWPGGWRDRVRTSMLLSGWGDAWFVVLALAGLGAAAAVVTGLARDRAVTRTRQAVA